MMGPTKLSIVTSQRDFEVWIAMSLAQKKRIRKLAISINWFDDDDIERTAGAIVDCPNLVTLLLDQGDTAVERFNRWGNVSAAIHGAKGRLESLEFRGQDSGMVVAVYE
jgi:hypothetical protein